MTAPDLRIDARSLPCPMPLLKLKQALHQMTGGTTVQLLASDPNSRHDIVRFCQIAGHVVTQVMSDAPYFEFLIVKSGS